MVVCPGHDRDEVQHTKDSLPVVPVHLIEQGKQEASGEGSCVDSGCERDEAGESFPKSRAEALRIGRGKQDHCLENVQCNQSCRSPLLDRPSPQEQGGHSERVLLLSILRMNVIETE